MRKNLQTILSNNFSAFSKIAFGVLICLFISLQSGYAQEDKSRSNKKKLRETKFKTRSKQGDKIHKGDITGRKKKIKKTKNKSKISSPSSTPYSSAFYGNKGRKKEGKQVKKSEGYFNTPSRPSENHRKGDISGRDVRRSVTRTGESKSVRAPSNPYAGRKARSESKSAKSSRAQAGGFQSASIAGENKPRKRKRIQPRSASRAFIARKKVNAYAGRGARRGEKARTKDIAGRALRSKNYRSRSQPIIKPTFNPYFAKKRVGDKSRTAIKGTGYASATKKGERKYKGQASGGYSSATKRGENAWRKDITGRDFKRPKDPGIVTGTKGQPFTGTQNRNLSISGALKNNNRRTLTPKGAGGSISKNIWRGKGKAIPRKDLGSPRVSGFTGNVKGSRRPLKGGGSISNSIWQGKGKAIPRKDLGSPRVSGFAGNVKGSRKPLKGGGSISKNIWQGKGKALPRKDLANTQVSGFSGRYKKFELSPGFDTRSSKFQGNVKGNRKPLKGGGSISRTGWNNNRQALPKKDLAKSSSRFAGNIKGNRKPLKGGGSISRSGWNNNRQALPKKDLARSSSRFAGNIKGSRKPLKGGGSISRSGWNNNQQALPKKDLARSSSRFAGNIKGSRKPLKGGGSISRSGWNNDQQALPKKDLARSSSRFAGNIKGSRKPLKGGGSISRSGWNNDQQALPKKDLARSSSRFAGNLKRKSKYKDKPNAVDDALKAKEPHKNVFQTAGYQGTLKAHRKYRKKPNAHEDALKGLAPKKAVANLDSYVSKYTKVKYTKKPNAHEDALKGIAPKNSASKAMAFQGNFKVKKTYDRNMHPSSKYTTSLHPRNSLKEKERVFKFNIWWAKLFKKNENQPTAVKEKTRNPRYDKREKDLWYD